MIRFGPAGIPLSCKGRTLGDGIEDVHNLGLTAMELQLVRVNVSPRFAGEEEAGLTPRTLPGELVVALQHPRAKKKGMIYDIGEEIQKGDVLYFLSSGIAKDFLELEHLGRIAKELDILMSVHTPYYMDLAADGDIAQRSMDGIRWGGLIGHAIGATIVVTHLGLYSGLAKKEATRRISASLEALTVWFEENELSPALGLETSGRQEVFGSLEEVMQLCKTIDGLQPVVNFAHLHSRGGGNLRTMEDFIGLIDKVEKYGDEPLHTQFSGVEHEAGNELRYTPIKRGDLRFEPLAEAILEEDYQVTLISSSPLLEHDAMYMKVIMERVLARRLAKRLRQRKDEED